MLLLSRDRAYAVRAAVTVAFVSTVIRGIPAEVVIGTADGMPKDCAVNLDVINTIPKALLLNRITTLSAAKMALVESAIKFAIDLR